jgi:lipid A ethanolaminephosphotransferase
MFSFLGKRGFRPEQAERQSNVLDVIARAGVRVVWLENNSGSKGVAERVEHALLRDLVDPRSPLQQEGACYDEALVDAAAARIDSSPGDVLLVLHSLGSHGPAYWRRCPPAFEVFLPCCREGDLARCPRDEVVNAYDNTIVYTDYVLDRLIGLLERRGEDAAFLLYASDHGESLGENGVWLHGLPEMVAPEAQTRIPMLAWLSPGYLADRGLDVGRLRKRAASPCSHDHLPHTLLGMYGIETVLYRADLDLLRLR